MYNATIDDKEDASFVQRIQTKITKFRAGSGPEKTTKQVDPINKCLAIFGFKKE
jgi:hypothetical protein